MNDIQEQETALRKNSQNAPSEEDQGKWSAFELWVAIGYTVGLVGFVVFIFMICSTWLQPVSNSATTPPQTMATWLVTIAGITGMIGMILALIGTWRIFQRSALQDKALQRERSYYRALIGLALALLFCGACSMAAIAGFGFAGALPHVFPEGYINSTGGDTDTAVLKSEKGQYIAARLLISFVMALIGSLFFVYQATKNSREELNRPFHIGRFWSGLIFRAGEAVLFTIFIYLWLRARTTGTTGVTDSTNSDLLFDQTKLPFLALIAGIAVKPMEELILGLTGRILAGFSALVGRKTPSDDPLDGSAGATVSAGPTPAAPPDRSEVSPRSDAMIEFDPSNTRFNHTNAYWMGRAANLAYRSDSKIKAVLEDWGMKVKFINDKDTGTQCFVAGDRDAIIVSFRGTEPKELSDILTDLKFKLKKGPLGTVHDGFLTAIEAVWDKIDEHIRQFQKHGQPIWFTGHSLGAALATLAVAKMYEEDRPVAGLYTFGSPRVGDEEFERNFALKMRQNVFRYVNNHDIVTRLPPRSMKYRHVGAVKYFDSDGQLRQDQSFWNRFVDTVTDVIKNPTDMFEQNVGDHSMDAYVKLLLHVARNPPTDDGDWIDRFRGFFGS